MRALLAYHSGATEESLSDEPTPQNTQGWDSLAHLNLIASIEDEFGVTVSTDDVIRMRSLREIEDYLAGIPSAVQ